MLQSSPNDGKGWRGTLSRFGDLVFLGLTTIINSLLESIIRVDFLLRVHGWGSLILADFIYSSPYRTAPSQFLLHHIVFQRSAYHV